MKVCANCRSSKTIVQDSRTIGNGTIWRRRVCQECNHKYSTHEGPIGATPQGILLAQAMERSGFSISAKPNRIVAEDSAGRISITFELDPASGEISGIAVSCGAR